MGTDAEDVPILPFRILARGVTWEVLDYIIYLQRRFLYQNGILEELNRNLRLNLSIPPPKHRLEIGVTELGTLRDLIGWQQTLRIIYFFPMYFQKYLTMFSAIFLGAYLYLGSVENVALLLLLAHIVLLFRNWIWIPIPEILNPQALGDIYTPEYKMREKIEEIENKKVGKDSELSNETSPTIRYKRDTKD